MTDVLIGRGGDLLKGLLLNTSLHITTAYGTLEFAKDDIRMVELRAPGVHEVDTIRLVNQDEFSGTLVESSFRFRHESGKDLEVPRDALLSILVGWYSDVVAGPLLTSFL